RVRPDEGDDHGDHCGEDRPVDEEAGQAHFGLQSESGGERRRSAGQPASEAVAAAAVAGSELADRLGGSIRPARAATLLPGSAICVPEITTRSVGRSPLRTTRSPPSITGPSVTSRAATVSSRPTT